MKTYVFLADGFEPLEVFAPVDVLKRCGAEVIMVSTGKDLFVASSGSQKNIIKADVMLSDIDYKAADLVIVPGGYPGYINLRENKEVVDIVKYFLDNDKYVASICGGPTIFSYNNLANGAKLTGHSAVKEELSKNHIYVDVPTHVDGKIITGVGAGQAINFAFKIAEQFFDKEKIEEVKKGKAMRLPQWSKDVMIKAQFPDENSKMTAPYLYVESRYGRVPWKETVIELFSEEWEVV